LLDIDHFRQINDTYGHDIGDAILIKLAAMINKWFDGMLVARYGGEQFIILMQGLDANKINSLMNTFKDNVARKVFEIEDNDISFSVSIGIANNINIVSSLDELINHADAALYQAKESGRNAVIWEDEPLGF